MLGKIFVNQVFFLTCMLKRINSITILFTLYSLRIVQESCLIGDKSKKKQIRGGAINNTIIIIAYHCAHLCERGICTPRKIRSAKREDHLRSATSVREEGRGNAVKRYIFLKIRELADTA